MDTVINSRVPLQQTILSNQIFHIRRIRTNDRSILHKFINFIFINKNKCIQIIQSILLFKHSFSFDSELRFSYFAYFFLNIVESFL